ncbi:hypothetical protein RRG08_020095 [Elysia crispata]|uniref:Uncharacterized protein n=1 Tax=Elysia crispata TaxID=231223 RepID=A0AAE1DSE3_9GAST|nr:hypothetical protein RRG08_020095 [Elysia crispata]
MNILPAVQNAKGKSFSIYELFFNTLTYSARDNGREENLVCRGGGDGARYCEVCPGPHSVIAYRPQPAAQALNGPLLRRRKGSQLGDIEPQ